MSIMPAVANDPAFGAPPATVESKAYRDGMAKLAAAVNIVTSTGPDGWCGFTASAVCSVTDSPPTLVVCANKSSQSYETLKTAQVLCINTVSAAHEALAMRFSGQVKLMAERFSGESWRTAVTGSPMLVGAAAAFDCRIVTSVEIGTHEAFFCEVVAIQESPAAAGLVYFGRKFHAVG